MRVYVILATIFLIFLYIGIELSRGVGNISWIALAILVGGIFLYPVLRKSSSGLTQKLLPLIQLAMAFLSFVFTFTVLRDLLAVVLSLTNSGTSSLIYSPQGAETVWLLSLASLILGLLNVNRGPRIKRVTIPIKDLPASLEGTQIAQISDLHVGSAVGLEFVKNVVAKVQTLAPDLVVFTGDIADGAVQAFKQNLEPIRNAFKVPMYYVPGNHEYYWDAKEWFEVFKNLGMHLLMNSHEIQDRSGGKIMLAGVVDPTARMTGGSPDAKKALGNDSADVKILLAHQPGISTEAEQLGFDLQLSGHTHGGQFFPWTMVIKKVHRHYNGLQKEGRMWVYVNPGTGHWGPPVRLGTRAEITLLNLIRA